MQKAADQRDWEEMYVYQTDVYADLHTTLIEYLHGCEHAGMNARCVEVSPGAVDDIEAWREKRKVLLLEDFSEYLIAFLAQTST